MKLLVLYVIVRVVEIAGGRAYLEPGADGGLGRGAVVQLRGKSFTVLGATGAHAVIDPGDTPLRVGDRGEAKAAPVSQPTTQRAAPEPLSRFAGQWRDPRWPAADQQPTPVPLGSPAAAAVHLTLVGQGLVIVPGSGEGPTTGHLELDGRLSVEPWRERPFGFDADAAALLWLSDAVAPVAGAQPSVQVRELRLRYGGELDPFGALGRLRWAARTVGLLDGVRLRTPAAGGFAVAGFGGFVPNVVTGAPASDTARFGAEATYDAPVVHAAVTAWGSTFGGAVDERRLAASIDAAPGPLELDARAELALFDADNPWGLSQLELVAAGAGAGLHLGPWRADLRLDLRQPERSRYLASLLPAGWLCGAEDPCGRLLRLSATGRVAWESRRLAIGVGASTIDGDETSVFGDAMVRGLFGHGRVGLGVTAVQGSFLNQRALRVEAGATFGALDLAAHWRGATLDYVAATSVLIEHRVGLDAGWSLGPRTDFVVSAEGTTGPDIDALVLLATVVWRPLP